MKRVLILFGLMVCTCSALWAQCPNADSIVQIVRSRQLNPKQKLSTLLYFKSQAKPCAFADSTWAILLNGIASAYGENGDYLEGIHFINVAIQFITTNEKRPSINRGYRSTCYYNLSRMYDALQNKPEKMRAVDSCIKIGSRFNVFNGPFIYALLGKSEYCFHIGDYDNCYAYADMAQKLALKFAKSNDPSRNFGKKWAQTAIAYKINALLALKKYDEATALAAEQLKSDLSPDYLGTAYEQLADVEMEKGSFQAAQAYLEAALRFERKLNNVANCKVLLNNIGVLRSRWVKNKDAAIPYYLQAYRYCDHSATLNGGDSIENVNALANLGIAYTTKKKFDSAFYFFNLSYQYVGNGWDENSFLASQSHVFTSFSKMDYLTKLVIAKADAYLEQYKTNMKTRLVDEAIRMYTVIDKILFRIKTEQSNLDSKLAWRISFHPMYENAIEACLLKKDMNAAFYFFERSKAMLLIDQLNEERWTANYDILKQNQLKKQILQLDRQIANGGLSSALSDSLQKELFGKVEKLEEIKLQIRRNNPLYYQYSMDTSSIRISDVQQIILKDHAALVEIFSGDSGVYVMMITPKQMQLKKLNRNLFDSLSNKFIRCVANEEWASGNYQDCTAASARLYELIFSNLHMPPGRIIISPDGKYFPFEALVTGQKAKLPVYFTEDHAVSYAYSARYLMLSFQKNTNTSERNFMGMAPVHFAAANQLAELRGSDASIKRLTSDFSKADSYLSSAATKDEFLQNFHRYRLIQLYTHAADTGYYKEPVIYFADSALMLSDLMYEHAPSTQLIVLSGCETGSGKLYEGEGVFSFNRGFAAIGIPSCIANLWQVESTSTYQLTELFHKNLSKGMPLDLALQAAKKEFIKTSPIEKQLPYYWAAPILTGRTDAIQFKSNDTWKYLLGGVMILGLVIGGVQFRRRASATKSS